MTEAVLEAVDIDAGYGGTIALRGFAVRLVPGRITCLLGANGAGKTTALGAIGGWVRPRAGSIRLRGQDVTNRRADARVRAGLGVVPEGRQLFPDMSVAEHLQLASRVVDNGHPIDYVLQMFPVLRDRAGQSAGTLSGGEQQMLAIARAVVQRPAVLLLDEPSLGLAPLIVGSVLHTARRIADAGTPVLLAEQNASLALRWADDALVLENGRVVLRGSPTDIGRDLRLREAYLGSDSTGSDSDRSPA
ncbi:MAG: ATP-binding cassette domain-containing protein [Micromonosporaceae bacterium]|nr:ATP-binding cassette domain-containing protein [Micromonosporaceae bacterium]